MQIKDLAQKRVAIFGYGQEGRSILKAIRKQLPELPISVLNDTSVQIDDVSTRVYHGIAVQDALLEQDVVIKSPGISAYRDDILAAKAKGVLFTSATRLWFAQAHQAKTICITGTKGKSTTSSLIAHLLTQAGLRVGLGGNIGHPLFDLESTEEPDVWVIELSSYQTSDFDGQPDISLVLNLFPEHLDWHQDEATYFRDKLNLLVDNPSGIKLINYTDPLTQQYAPPLDNCHYFNHPQGLHVQQGHIYASSQPILDCQRIALPGEHNLSNVCAALAVIQQLDIDLHSLAPAVNSFQSLPHRLHELGEKHGIRYVDDSISTTPHSALAAVQAYPEQDLTLLVGGYERGVDWRVLVEFAQQRPIQRIITLPDNGPRIAACLRAHCTPDTVQVHEAEDLQQAVKTGATTHSHRWHDYAIAWCPQLWTLYQLSGQRGGLC